MGLKIKLDETRRLAPVTTDGTVKGKPETPTKVSSDAVLLAKEVRARSFLTSWRRRTSSCGGLRDPSTRRGKAMVVAVAWAIGGRVSRPTRAVNCKRAALAATTS